MQPERVGRTGHFSALALLVAAGVTACISGTPGRAAPLDRFYYPAGLVQVDSDVDGGQGTLYVASTNYDRRYTHSTVLAVNLDALGLPAFGAEVPDGGPPEIDDLQIGPSGSVLVATFANEMRAFPLPDDAGVRLFVPSRAEDNRLNIIDAQGDAMTCFDNPATRDCGAASPNLISLARTKDGTPQAPEPNGVGLSPGGKVLVTHQQPAKLANSTDVGTFYMVEMDAILPTLSKGSYIPIAPCGTGTACVGGSYSVTAGARYAYVTGMIGPLTTNVNNPSNPYNTNNSAYGTGFGGSYGGTNLPPDTTVALPGNILRYVELVPDANGVQRSGTANIELADQMFEGRGVAVNADESRIYLVARGLDSFTSSGPSTLVVLGPIGPTSDAPVFPIVNLLPLPERADSVTLIPRPGKSDLVLIVCEDASALVVYDDEQGRIVANLNGLGTQPDQLAVDYQGAGVRLYLSAFTDGQVLVIDMPDLDRPEELRLVARLGASQACTARPNDPACMGVTQ